MNLFSGASADPPSSDFIMRNAMDAQEVAVGWWPGDGRYPKAAFYAYGTPRPGVRGMKLPRPPRGGTARSGSTWLDWDDVRAAAGIRGRRRWSSPGPRSARPA